MEVYRVGGWIWEPVRLPTSLPPLLFLLLPRCIAIILSLVEFFLSESNELTFVLFLLVQLSTDGKTSPSHVICADGAIHRLPVGGTARVEVLNSGVTGEGGVRVWR